MSRSRVSNRRQHEYRAVQVLAALLNSNGECSNCFYRWDQHVAFKSEKGQFGIGGWHPFADVLGSSPCDRTMREVITSDGEE